jgi:4-hydroxymandelate oxidase
MGRWTDSLEGEAVARLPEPVRRYIQQGARSGVSAAEAVTAWDSARLLPRVLHDVSAVDLTTRMLGTELAAPIAVAPTTMQRAVYPEGETAMAEGVKAAGSLMCVSSNCGTPFDQIAKTGVAWWLQMYLTADRAHSLAVLEAAVSAGARAVVLTLDTPVVGTKYDDGPTIWETVSPDWLRVNFAPGHDLQPGSDKATDIGPADIGWLHEVTGLPVVVKGVLRPTDAVRCVDAGAAAVWVSNHGGRQLDRVLATADAIRAVVDAVRGRVEVYVDGGIRNAEHIAIALGRGADAVLLGRLPLYALTVDGGRGVQQMLAELTADLLETLALLGCGSVAELRDADAVVESPRPVERSGSE